MLLYPGCIFLEVAAAVDLLAEHCDMSYLTPGGDVHEASNGVRMIPTGSYADSTVRGTACIVVPGGNPDSIIESGAANECLRVGVEGGAVLAGICAGSLVLARAGVLKGRRITHSYTAEFTTSDVVACTSPIYEGARYERADLVVDLPVITAQYWAADRFAVAVAEAIGVMSRVEGEAHLQRYARRLDGPRD